MNFDEESFARMIERSGGDEPPRPEHRDQLRKQVLEAFERAQMPQYTVKFSRHLFLNWRYIMRHPISRITAAAIFIFVLVGVVLWFHVGGTKVAFADFIETFVTARSAKFTTIIKTDDGTDISKGMFLAPNRFRNETSRGMVSVIDRDKGKWLLLYTDKKHAGVTSFVNTPQDKGPKNMFLEMRAQLLDAQNNPDVKREELGEKEIKGRRAVGYRLTIGGDVLTLWGDPNTGLPILVEMTYAHGRGGKRTMTDFEFNMDLDESLFSTDPPAGYTVRSMQLDASPPGEKDVIESLRIYSDLFGGAFPDDLILNDKVMNPIMEKIYAKKGWELKTPSQAQHQELTGILTKIGGGFGFAMEILPAEANAHYAGKGVKYGTANTPIFWYLPKDSKKYRVIYADLSILEADTPPSAPNAQAIGKVEGKK